eukprot:Filipodium_phascolosomae@DN1368_c0_g1_i1.p1
MDKTCRKNVISCAREVAIKFFNSRICSVCPPKCVTDATDEILLEVVLSGGNITDADQPTEVAANITAILQSEDDWQRMCELIDGWWRQRPTTMEECESVRGCCTKLAPKSEGNGNRCVSSGYIAAYTTADDCSQCSGTSGMVPISRWITTGHWIPPKKTSYEFTARKLQSSNQWKQSIDFTKVMTIFDQVYQTFLNRVRKNYLICSMADYEAALRTVACNCGFDKMDCLMNSSAYIKRDAGSVSVISSSNSRLYLPRGQHLTLREIMVPDTSNLSLSFGDLADESLMGLAAQLGSTGGMAPSRKTAASNGGSSPSKVTASCYTVVFNQVKTVHESGVAVGQVIGDCIAMSTFRPNNTDNNMVKVHMDLCLKIDVCLPRSDQFSKYSIGVLNTTVILSSELLTGAHLSDDGMYVCGGLLRQIEGTYCPVLVFEDALNRSDHGADVSCDYINAWFEPIQSEQVKEGRASTVYVPLAEQDSDGEVAMHTLVDVKVEEHFEKEIEAEFDYQMQKSKERVRKGADAGEKIDRPDNGAKDFRYGVTAVIVALAVSVLLTGS